MQEKDNYNEDGRTLMLVWLRTLVSALCAIALLALAILMCGCSPKTVYVPAERIVERTDTVTRFLTVTDSVVSVERIYESDTRYDSIAPILDSLNRVIGWDRYHFREVGKMVEADNRRLLAVIDSLREAKSDTVKTEVSVPYPVERELTGWEKTKMDFGGLAIGGICAVIVVAVVVWLVKRKRRR